MRSACMAAVACALLGCAGAAQASSSPASALFAGATQAPSQPALLARADSPLAYRLMADVEATPALATDPSPRLMLAQRSIDREWTTRSDSLVNANFLRGGKSEPAAMGLSMLVPGAGQLYVGERSGFVYLAAEALAIAGVVFLNHRAGEYNADAAQVAGTPSDSSSGWSVARWSSATGGDPATLEALYHSDREAYYEVIGKNPSYAAGWASASDQQEFINSLELADNRLYRAHVLTSALWVNHLASAVDALRAARVYNLPLRDHLRIRGNVRWRHGSPDVRLALSGSF